MFEPALDHVVAVHSRFPFDKFEHGERRSALKLKATGAMAIGRKYRSESLLKLRRSLEIGVYHNEIPELGGRHRRRLAEKIVKAQDDRLFYFLKPSVRLSLKNLRQS